METKKTCYTFLVRSGGRSTDREGGIMIKNTFVSTTSNGFRAVRVWGKDQAISEGLVSLVRKSAIGTTDLALIEVHTLDLNQPNADPTTVFLCEGMRAYDAARFIFGAAFAAAHRVELENMSELDYPNHSQLFISEVMQWLEDNAPYKRVLSSWYIHDDASDMFFKAWDALA